MTEQDVVQRMVDKLREARVWEGQGSVGDFHDDEKAVTMSAHPLAALWESQDARGVESGLTVPCGRCCREHPGSIHLGYVWERDKRPDMKCPDCNATGRVARSLDGLSEGMIRGFVEDLCRSVGWWLDVERDMTPIRASIREGDWRYVETNEPIAFGYGDTEARAALEAMEKAIEVVE